MLFSMTVTFAWRGAVRNEEINLLHAEGFDHEYGEWLHVDFDDHLKSFYFDACGFRPTNAGLIQLR